MKDAATRFGSDDLSHRIPVSGDDELAQLGNAFNAMASSRQGSRADLRESEQRFRALVHHASDVFTVIGADGVIRYQSPAIEQVLGYPTEAIIGRSFLNLIDPHDQDIARQLFERSQMQPGVPTVGEVHMRPREDMQAPRHFEMTATDLLDDSTVRGLVLNYRDITERALYEQQLSQQAFHDALTSLPNRALFQDRLEHALRQRGQTVGLLFVDLDHFKVVNDSLGHDAGDQLLCDVAQRLAGCLREGDTLARLGGDEFTVLMPDIAGAQDAATVASRIESRLEPPFELPGQSVFVTASIGIATGVALHDRSDALLRDADAAMYEAKARGRARHALFDPTMHTRAVTRLAIETDLRRAIDNDQLELHYQPIMWLQSNMIVGVEALVRWRRPDGTLVPPGEFVPVAEETGLIRPIGRWVLHEACRQLARWRFDLPQAAGLAMSVNISARQLQDASIVEELLSLDVQAAKAVPDLAATALAEILPELAELRPVSGRPIDPESRRALTLQGAVRLASAAVTGGVLILVDDAQWADASSLDLLQRIAQHVPGVHLVVAQRPEEVAEHAAVSAFVTGLRELGGLTELRLGPLGTDAVAELFEDKALVQAVIEASDGSPLALVECIQDLADRGAIELRGSGRWQARSPITTRLARDAARAGQERAVAARTARLSPSRREVLQLLALLGREVPARLLAQAAGVTEAEALDALDALARGRLARLGDHGWATEHDSIAEAVARRLSAEARAPLHTRLAEALRRQGGDPSEVAHHLAGSGDRSAAAGAYAEAARLALDRFANEEATRLVDQALALRPDEPVRRAILEVRAEVRARTGELAGARADLREALAGTAVSAARARLLARLAMLTLGAEDELRAAELVDLALAEAGGEPQARAGALAVGAIVDLNVNRLDRSAERFDEALELFQRGGDARGVAGILDGRAMAAFLAGRIREPAEAFDRAATLYVDSGQLLPAVSPRPRGSTPW